MKYQITMVPWFLNDIGVSYHDYGVLKDRDTGRKLFDCYKCDVVTYEQKAKIREWCKDVRFLGVANEYAPELSKPVIAFPKAGFYATDNKFR